MRLGWIFAALAALCVSSWLGPANAAPVYKAPPPPLDADYYPCAEICHNDLKTNPKHRKLEDEHTGIELHHAEDIRWCLDCHDADNRDVLHLQNGDKVEFTESYRLCGQCHGDKYRDWKAGIHGKRTGQWDGDKEYLLCAHCHNPHSPRYKPLKPEPPPEVPGRAGKPPHSPRAAH
ncbi:MAG TPA: hypothetical protein VIU40_06600 [Geobacteraceae bacterium]